MVGPRRGISKAVPRQACDDVGGGAEAPAADDETAAAAAAAEEGDQTAWGPAVKEATLEPLAADLAAGFGLLFEGDQPESSLSDTESGEGTSSSRTFDGPAGEPGAWPGNSSPKPLNDARLGLIK